MDKLSQYKRIEHIKKSFSEINQRIRFIERSDASAEGKKELIDALKKRQDQMARLIK